MKTHQLNTAGSQGCWTAGKWQAQKEDAASPQELGLQHQISWPLLSKWGKTN